MSQAIRVQHIRNTFEQPSKNILNTLLKHPRNNLSNTVKETPKPAFATHSKT